MKCRLKLLFATVWLLVATGCEVRQAMYNQPKQKPFSESELFTDRRASRPLVEGTVARGKLQEDDHYWRGRQGGRPATAFPIRIEKAELLRGRERYDIYCSACHGYVGEGDGMVVQRGFPHPRSFHTNALRSAPVGHFFDAITSGWGAMFPMNQQITAEDRWKIVAYIRALQLSQHATLADVPPEAMAIIREHKR